MYIVNFVWLTKSSLLMINFLVFITSRARKNRNGRKKSKARKNMINENANLRKEVRSK